MQHYNCILQRKVFIGVLRTKNMTQITKRIRVVSYHLEMPRKKSKKKKDEGRKNMLLSNFNFSLAADEVSHYYHTFLPKVSHFLFSHAFSSL